VCVRGLTCGHAAPGDAKADLPTVRARREGGQTGAGRPGRSRCRSPGDQRRWPGDLARTWAEPASL